MDNEYVKVDALDAQPGDRFTFVATNDIRFGGLILAREESNLVQVRWDSDGHESWTALVVSEGTVEVERDGEMR